VDSLTRRRVRADELAAMVCRGFGPSARVETCRELPAGSYNAAYEVRLADGQDLVLKIAPPPHPRLLSHEVDLMRTEVEVYAHSAAAGVPAPTVVFSDFDRTLLGSDYAFLSRLPGRPLDRAGRTMTGEQVAAARRQAASVAARLHRITGTGYGYPRRGGGSWCSTWRAAFGAMVADLLGDAERLGALLPAPPARIGELVRRHADVLDDVRRPALVHFDLWDGNILVTRCRGRDSTDDWQVSGLIDAERAFYGDPLAELVSLTLLREVDEAPEVLDGFADGSGAPVELTGRVRRRLALYRTYLYLILAVERRVRGRADRTWMLGPLERQLDLLAAGQPGR
jgi:aminoglycoside phosphotransferase (APT) family kinase protein